MGIEEAAQKVLADHRRAADQDAERQRRRAAEREAAIQEFVDLAEARNFPVETAYEVQYPQQAGATVAYNPRVSGWVAITDHPGEYDTCAAKGVIVSSDGTLRKFKAETRDYLERAGASLVGSPFYGSYPYTTSDVALVLTQDEASIWDVDPAKLPECAAWYLAIGK